MFNFVICDDDKDDLRIIKDNILDYFTDKNIKTNPKIHTFTKYDLKFLEIINRPFNKVYILDINVKGKRGTDIAKIIRKKDKKSLIIFVTGDITCSSTILENNYIPFTFVDKYNNFEKRLKEAIDSAFDNTNEQERIIIKDRTNTYSFNTKDILYITKDTVERKSLIKTEYGEYYINKTLKQLQKNLNENFIKLNRSLIANKINIIGKNQKEKQIYFNNGEKTDQISRNFDWSMLDDRFRN